MGEGRTTGLGFFRSSQCHEFLHDRFRTAEKFLRPHLFGETGARSAS